ncbi:MAG TPA: glycerol-3-phosphate acyltransferase [Pseudomonadales bacterium]|nr:glycerol-3-phosphate acyltransferase [Pseudomonadales bacterium]
MELIEHLQMANWPRGGACAAVAYFIGCFTTGYYLVRMRTGKDIREMGSGSAGARNVGRVLGKPGFFITVLGDFAKGYLAVFLAHKLAGNELFCAAMAVVGVVAGHLWPVQLKFHGGKGITTSMAALLAFNAAVAWTTAGLFVVVFIFARKTLLPAMFAFVCLPWTCWFFTRSDVATCVMTVLAATIVFAHRKNLAEELVTLKSEHRKI